jgi:hypothetical protein
LVLLAFSPAREQIPLLADDVPCGDHGNGGSAVYGPESGPWMYVGIMAQ